MTPHPKDALIQELGLEADAFIAVPAYFAYSEPNQAYSLLPNMLNLVVVNGRIIVPEPFYDGFKGECVARLSAIGYQEGSSLQFIDDWDVYHERDGEIHCGTYAKRTSSQFDWWSQDAD